MDNKPYTPSAVPIPMAPAAPLAPHTPLPTYLPAHNLSDAPATANPKNYVKALIFSSMFGYWGVDRFYLGKIGTGVLKLLTFGGLGIWALIDFIITLIGDARAKDSILPLEDTEKYKPFFVRLTIIYLLVLVAVFTLEIILISATASLHNHNLQTMVKTYNT